MTHGGSGTTRVSFPAWRGLSLLEDLVACSWRDEYPRPLASLDGLSADELASAVDTFEMLFVATHFLKRAATRLREEYEPARSFAAESGATRADALAQNGSNPTINPHVEDESLIEATWALHEFLGWVEAFAALHTYGDEDAGVEGLLRRLSGYNLARLRWLQGAGEAVSAACGLILMEAEFLSSEV